MGIMREQIPQELKVEKEPFLYTPKGLTFDLTSFVFTIGQDVDITSVVDPKLIEDIQNSKTVPDISVAVNYAAGDSPYRFKLVCVDNIDILYFVEPVWTVDSITGGMAPSGFLILDMYSDGESVSARLNETQFNYHIDFGETDLSTETVITDKISYHIYTSLVAHEDPPILTSVTWKYDSVNHKLMSTSNYFVRRGFNSSEVYFYGLHIGDSGADGMVYLKMFRDPTHGSVIKGQSYVVLW